MIEIKTQKVTPTQLVLLKHFEDSFMNLIKKGLADSNNNKLRVGIGMQVSDKEAGDDHYKLKNNASFLLKGSYQILAIAQKFLESTPFHTIIPNGVLKIDLDFQEKDVESNIDENKDIPLFIPTTPKYSFDQVILQEETKKEILNSLKIIKYKDFIYKDWGFEDIDPVPRSILNFYGESGTGKTMTAHAVANYLGKHIMLLNYAEIESKYVGEAPKNLQKAFETAKESDSVLFFDEADSFLGKRIQNVTHGSDQALNSLRSQMLILLEEFSGVVIFATNLVTNFDHAFESRILKHLYFGLPNREARTLILQKMLPSKLPMDGTFTMDNLFVESETIEGFSGRDIKNAVLDMLLEKVDNLHEGTIFTLSDLHNALEKRKQLKKKLQDEAARLLKEKIVKKLEEKAIEQRAIGSDTNSSDGNNEGN